MTDVVKHSLNLNSLDSSQIGVVHSSENSGGDFVQYLISNSKHRQLQEH